MRYSKQISTGLILESQSGGDPNNSAHLQTLTDNAMARGLAESDIEVGYCTDADMQVLYDAKETAWDVADPMRKWKRTMQETDAGMPRYFEDHLRDDHDGVAGNEFLQGKYDAKKALRLEKP